MRGLLLLLLLSGGGGWAAGRWLERAVSGTQGARWLERWWGRTGWARHTIGTHGNWMHDVEVADLASYELEGMMWNARVWVVSASLIKERGKVRIHGVDPGTSWFHKAWSEDD